MTPVVGFVLIGAMLVALSLWLVVVAMMLHPDRPEMEMVR